jgi:hypothetical protein
VGQLAVSARHATESTGAADARRTRRAPATARVAELVQLVDRRIFQAAEDAGFQPGDGHGDGKSDRLRSQLTALVEFQQLALKRRSDRAVRIYGDSLDLGNGQPPSGNSSESTPSSMVPAQFHGRLLPQ